jgi:hypothetical protein
MSYQGQGGLLKMMVALLFRKELPKLAGNNFPLSDVA